MVRLVVGDHRSRRGNALAILERQFGERMGLEIHRSSDDAAKSGAQHAARSRHPIETVHRSRFVSARLSSRIGAGRRRFAASRLRLGGVRSHAESRARSAYLGASSLEKSRLVDERSGVHGHGSVVARRSDDHEKCRKTRVSEFFIAKITLLVLITLRRSLPLRWDRSFTFYLT